jgi:hypothetical protein
LLPGIAFLAVPPMKVVSFPTLYRASSADRTEFEVGGKKLESVFETGLGSSVEVRRVE